MHRCEVVHQRPTRYARLITMPLRTLLESSHAIAGAVIFSLITSGALAQSMSRDLDATLRFRRRTPIVFQALALFTIGMRVAKSLSSSWAVSPPGWVRVWRLVAHTE